MSYWKGGVSSARDWIIVLLATPSLSTLVWKEKIDEKAKSTIQYVGRRICDCDRLARATGRRGAVREAGSYIPGGALCLFLGCFLVSCGES